MQATAGGAAVVNSRVGRLPAAPDAERYAAFNFEVMPMRKLVIQEFVTIDGFAAAPDGALDFMPAGGRTPADPQVERNQLRFIKDEVDTMLGRTTYPWTVPRGVTKGTRPRLCATAWRRRLRSSGSLAREWSYGAASRWHSRY
jgi:hypothetical protein